MRKTGAVQKLTDNVHLNLYHIDARDTEGNLFDYYFASRNPEEKLKISTKGLDPEGIDLCSDEGVDSTSGADQRVSLPVGCKGVCTSGRSRGPRRNTRQSGRAGDAGRDRIYI